MRQITFSTIRIKQLPWLYLGYSIAIFCISMVTNITFVAVLNWGLWGYFIAWNVSEGALLIACTFLMLRFSTPSLNKAAIKEALAFSLPLIPNNIISSLSLVSDRYILQRFVSLEALGIYSLCIKFTTIITQLNEALKMSFAPFIFKSVSEDGKAAAVKIARIRMYYLLPIFGAGLVISFFIGDFVRIINRPAYFPVAAFVPLLVGPAIILSLFAYFASGMLLSKRTDKLLIPTVVQFMLVIIGGLLLIPSFHLVGIVISRFVTSIAFVGVGMLLSQKYFPIQIEGKKLALMLILLGCGIGLSRIIVITDIYISIVTNIAAYACIMIAITIILIEPQIIRNEWIRYNRKRRKSFI